MAVAEDSAPLTIVAPTSSLKSGLNVSKTTVDEAEKAGKSKISTQEIRASDQYVQSIVASSNYNLGAGHPGVSGLIKGFDAFASYPYWQSAGPSGSHHLTIEMKPGFIAETVGLVVDNADESYCPAELTVSVAQSVEALKQSIVHPVTHNFLDNGYRGQRFLFALLDNEDPSFKFIRIGIRRCVSSGQDTRVRGVVVRAKPAVVSRPAIPTASFDNSFRSFDSSFIWIQSITDGIVHELQKEHICNFSDCCHHKDVAGKIHKLFVRATDTVSKYLGPAHSQENGKLRLVRYTCSRNAVLRVVPETLRRIWRPDFDISSCLAAAVSNLCSEAMRCSMADTTDQICLESFESLIVLSDNVAGTFSVDDIRSTILQAIKQFIGKKLLDSALLQHALRTCSLSLWGQQGILEATSASLASVQPLNQSFVQCSSKKSPLLQHWRGPASRSEITGDNSTRIRFFDFSTLKGPGFHRLEKHGYYEIQVKMACSCSQFGFFTPEFHQDPSEIEKGCGDDSHSW